MAEPTKMLITDVSGAAAPITAVEAKFNPTEMTITRGANYAEVAVPGLRQPLLQFIRGDTDTLTAELFFDETETQTSIVTKASSPHAKSSTAAESTALDRLRAMTEIVSDLHAPPLVKLTWGQTLAFQGVITQLQQRFVLFAEDGKVLRARVNITVKSYVAAGAQAVESSAASPDRFKTRVVKAGDRLDAIAAEEYGDPALWPTIASFNNLARPRRLQVGAVLQIPPL